MALVADFENHVVQVVHRVNDLADERFLDPRDLRDSQFMTFVALAVAVQVAVDSVDVIGSDETDGTSTANTVGCDSSARH